MGENSDPTIASQEDLERFATREPAERQLTEPLKGVLAETALTGKNRYPFSLVKPVVELLLEQTLREYERTEATEGEGPAPPVLDGESLPETLSRFRSLLQGFTKAPWTIQRLCEILLNPTRQYRKLHKLALAIEKCLMVTGEVGITPRMPPPPRLSALQHVNDNSKCHDPQPAPHAPDRSRRASSPSGGMQDPDAEDSAAFTSALIDVRGVPPSSALHGASTSSNGPPHAPHSQHPLQQQQQQQQHGQAANNGHAQASQFAQFHTQQQQAHHGHGNHTGMEGEDERWPQQGSQHGFMASMLGHQHQHHASQEAAHSPHAAALPQQQQQQHHAASQGPPSKPAEDAAANAAAAAAAAVVGEGMEVETPSGVSAPPQQQQQQQQEGAAVAAAEAAARAVVEGLGGAMGASTSSGAAADAGSAGAGATPASGDGSAGSPGAGAQGEGSADRVPQTPPPGKQQQERMDEH